MLAWADFAQRDQLDVTLAFKRYVVEVSDALPNTGVVDLQGHDEITTDLDQYMDIYHFGPAVNRWIIERVCAGEDRVGPASVDVYERHLREVLARYHPPAPRAGQ
jgi:hypothetical protein